MTPLAFRNVETRPDDPVATWPLEAVQAALERGSLRDWRRLAREIHGDPWGRVARAVEEVLTYSRPYGTADALERVIASARAAARAAERRAVAEEVNDLLDASDRSRAELALAMGTSPSRLSTYATGKVMPSAALMVRLRRVASPRAARPD